MHRFRTPEFLLILLLPLVALINVCYYYGDFIEGADSISEARDTLAELRSGPPDPNVTPAAFQLAEQDDSDELPGRFVPSQGKQHTGRYPLLERIPFCPVDDVSDDCYASNPPSSGLHLPVQRNVRLPDGNRLDIPPDPGVYEFAIPREAIPHLEEHAGVYVGYRCERDACDEVSERLRDLVEEEISLGARVVMSPDPDLELDTIGLASWTRVDAFESANYDDARVRRFIKTHSCRYDPERFCAEQPVN